MESISAEELRAQKGEGGEWVRNGPRRAYVGARHAGSAEVGTSLGDAMERTAGRWCAARGRKSFGKRRAGEGCAGL